MNVLLCPLKFEILEVMCMTLVVCPFHGSCKEIGVMGEGGFLPWAHPMAFTRPSSSSMEIANAIYPQIGSIAAIRKLITMVAFM